ncbi:DNA-directed DNA polymerase epsilon, subunit B [Teratosphaeriaceae sp. CCFEE 6253]|nr:DNA-directed DNA polymerase epsilon, subunit B [Teratosphaeriaceae sp. CCFEE 6253]
MAMLSRPPDDVALSSSPGFGTPVHPILSTQPPHARPPLPPTFAKPATAPVIAVKLAPPTLRPVAFRTFTKKHNLTLQASALQALAGFIGRHCGTGWRQEGTGERVLEEVARLWKAESGGVLVEDGKRLQGILFTLQGCISGGRVGPPKTGGGALSRASTFTLGKDSAVDLSNGGSDARRPGLDSRNSSFGLSRLEVDEGNGDEEHDETNTDPRAWLKVLSAYDQPRFTFDVDKKHFVQLTSKPSLFPPPSRKTALFRERYNVIHQRLLRNEAFQTPSFSSRTSALSRTSSHVTEQQFYKITPIANLLGRGGTSHLLLGMLVIAPTGTLALNDPSGSISLDLAHAQALQGAEDGPWFCPGMIVLIDGVYEEDWAGAGSSGLGNTGGVGGTVGGRFLGFSIGSPLVEKRGVTLGITAPNAAATEAGGGFGWTDFTGLGSERAIGTRMRRQESRLLGSDADGESAAASAKKMVILAEVLLDQPATFTALRHVLSQYAAATEPPMAFLLIGNFCSRAAVAGAGMGSIEYKEIFNELAAALREFPSLLKKSTWVFVPGDNDPWASAFTAGASTALPREAVPDLFTSRVQRAFTEAGLSKEGVSKSVVWTSNPSKLTLFGPAHEVMVLRDDTSGRLRRNAIRIGQAGRDQQRDDQDAQAPPAASEDQLEEDVVLAGALPTTKDAAPSPAAPAAPVHSLKTDYATGQARKLIQTLLPQSHLSPFPLALRPLHWDHATSSALSLYPLPHTLVLADAEMGAFALTFEGCHVVNPGRLVDEGVGRRKRVGWVEYDLLGKRGEDHILPSSEDRASLRKRYDTLPPPTGPYEASASGKGYTLSDRRAK